MPDVVLAAVIVRSREFSVVGSELLTLAPGARVQKGLPVGSGAPEARPLTVQWTAGLLDEQTSHAREARDPSRLLEQGPDRQRTPGSCSGGVSSIDGASESGILTIRRIEVAVKH